MSRSAKWDALVQWVKDSFGPPPAPEHNESPFKYVEKKTQELKLGDYVVAYAGYIQRIGAVEYNGARLVVTKQGHDLEREWYAFEDDEFTIRVLREGK